MLFGPSGTGKSLLAQAVTVHIGGTFYQLSAAHLPSSTTATANRIDALFEVSLSGPVPAIIFIDECDIILSARATNRVAHLAGRFEHFMDNVLVTGATNEPNKIAPKIDSYWSLRTAGRFAMNMERLISTAALHANQLCPPFSPRRSR